MNLDFHLSEIIYHAEQLKLLSINKRPNHDIRQKPVFSVDFRPDDSSRPGTIHFDPDLMRLTIVAQQKEHINALERLGVNVTEMRRSIT